MSYTTAPTHWQETLQQIDVLLQEHTLLWRAEHCREHREAQQQPRYSSLFDALRQLGEAEVHPLQGDDRTLLNTLAPVFPAAGEIAQLIQIPTTPAVTASEPPPGLSGKKWHQVQAFLSGQRPHQQNVVEWCSGKGLIGEALSLPPHASTKLCIDGLDVDADLVAAGNQRAKTYRQRRRLHCCDIFDNASDHWLSPTHSVFALHACGGLHQHLLKRGCERGVAQVLLSPCCYHRFVEHYTPLSEQLKASPLKLSTHDLRLAVRQTATARRGEQEARRQLQRWHLATQQLAASRGLSMPHYRSLPHSAAKRGFGYFLTQQLAANKLSDLPISAEERHKVLDEAVRLQRDQEQRELAAMVFRRLLELRCVLDSVVYLQEQGYTVTLECFCPPQLSPRNLRINAWRSHP